MDSKIKVAVLGCGNRSYYVVNNLLMDSNKEVEVVSAYDPDSSELERALEHWNAPDACRAKTAEEAINFPGVTWVMVFSPNVFHKEQILSAFAAGKHVFTEKPLATTIDDCLEIYQAWKESDVLFATGFVLRYGQIYRKAKELLDSGRFGKLLAIEGNEHIAPAHGAYIMRNWRRYTKLSGPHILEKCCHDLDLINWFCNSLPSKVASFGGKSYFTKENADLEQKYGAETFYTWRDPKASGSAFGNDSDLMDTQVSVAEYRNNIRVSFTSTMGSVIPERRMFFLCTEGTIILELLHRRIECKAMGDDAVSVYEFLKADAHAGGDSLIMKELFDTMKNGTLPKCSGSEGLESAVFALALDQAATENKIVDLEPVWNKLNR